MGSGKGAGGKVRAAAVAAPRGAGGGGTPVSGTPVGGVGGAGSEMASAAAVAGSAQAGAAVKTGQPQEVAPEGAPESAGAAPPEAPQTPEMDRAYSLKELWQAEFQDHHGEVLELKDGYELTVGEHHNHPDSKVVLGKQKPHSTVGYYFTGGLDKLDGVEVLKDKQTVCVTTADGHAAAYNWQHRTAGQANTTEAEMTQAQAAAILAGDRQRVAHDPAPLAKQYAAAYDDYQQNPDAYSLLKATDAHYAWAKSNAHGGYTVGSPGLSFRAFHHAQSNNVAPPETSQAEPPGAEPSTVIGHFGSKTLYGEPPPPNGKPTGFVIQKGQEGLPVFYHGATPSEAPGIAAAAFGSSATAVTPPPAPTPDQLTAGAYLHDTGEIVATGVGPPSPPAVQALKTAFPQGKKLTYNGKPLDAYSSNGSPAGTANGTADGTANGTASGASKSPAAAWLPPSGKAFDPEKHGGHFDSLGEAEDWAKEAYSGWRGGLATTERSALNSYKGSGYRHLNRELRQKGDHSALSEHHRSMVRRMDRAFAKAPELSEPMVVYRGRVPDAVCESFSEGKEQGLVGRVFGDEAYMSTSLKRGVGKNFSSSSKHAPSVARITLPKGSRPVHLEGVHSMGEAEMLLPRGSRLMITNVYKKGNTNWVDAVALVD